LEFEGEARNSSLEDPLLGNNRRINRDLVSSVFTELRYDVPSPPYALGINYNQEREARDFRLDQSVIRFNERGNLGIFLEHKDIFGLTGTIVVRNLLNQLDAEERAVFVVLRFELSGSF